MSVMAATHQSAMGPYTAVAQVALASNSLTAVLREAQFLKDDGGGDGGGGGGGDGEGGDGDGGGGLGFGSDGEGGGGGGGGDERGGPGLSGGGEGEGGGGLGQDGGGDGGSSASHASQVCMHRIFFASEYLLHFFHLHLSFDLSAH